MGTILIHPTRHRHRRARAIAPWSRDDDGFLPRFGGPTDAVSIQNRGSVRASTGGGADTAPFERIIPLLLGAGTLCLSVAIVAVESVAILAMAAVILCAVAAFILAGHLLRRGALAICLGCLGISSFRLLADPGELRDTDFLITGLLATSVAACLAFTKSGSARAFRAVTLPIELAQEAILMRDANGIITFWSRGAERLYGWTRREALGRHADDLLRTRAPALFRSLESSGCWEGDMVRARRDGSRVVVRSRWTRPPEAANRSVATIEVAVDVTGEWDALHALDHTRAELARVARVRSLGDLTASIAHEVNQPLSAMVTNGEACRRWLERDTVDLEAVRSSIEKMIANGRRASEVVACLRSLASPSSPRATSVDVNHVAREVLSLLGEEAAVKHVALRVDLDPEIPLVLAGRVELRQVLVNLVMNAMQALETVENRPRDVRVSTRLARQGEVAIDVRDNGPGFGDVEPDLLFESFYSTKSNGMGLGLSICRSMLGKHGGRIVAMPAGDGPGACFTVHLRAGAFEGLPA